MVSLPTDRDLTATIERLLIVRLSAMGDIIHALPAVTALRNAFPNASIGWLIEERWAELLCALSYSAFRRRSPERPLVDRVHTVDTKAWRSAPFAQRTLGSIAVGLSQLRAPHYRSRSRPARSGSQRADGSLVERCDGLWRNCSRAKTLRASGTRDKSW